jgi:hypothetical protein
MTRMRVAANGRDFLVHARIGMLRALNPQAFCSEVGPGSREENASKQKTRASVPIQSERKRLQAISTR